MCTHVLNSNTYKGFFSRIVRFLIIKGWNRMIIVFRIEGIDMFF